MGVCLSLSLLVTIYLLILIIMIMINTTIMINLDMSTISSGCPRGNFLEELFKMPRNSRGVPKMACRFNPFSDNASVLLFVNV